MNPSSSRHRHRHRVGALVTATVTVAGLGVTAAPLAGAATPPAATPSASSPPVETTPAPTPVTAASESDPIPGAAAPELAKVTAAITGGVLKVTGTGGADRILLRRRAGDPHTVEVDVNADGSAQFGFHDSAFTSIAVSGGLGNDRLELSDVNGMFDYNTSLLGEGGNDVLIGASGNELLRGGPGADDLDGNGRNDVIEAGDGVDTIRWDSEDGNDNIRGGPGADRWIMTTSAAADVLTIGTVGTELEVQRLASTPTIVDIAAVETVSLRPLAGADSISLGSLAGAGVTTLEIDLAAPGGDDRAIDSIGMPATNLTFGEEGSTGVVTGLGAVVRVTNGVVGDRFQAIGLGGETVDFRGTPAGDQVMVNGRIIGLTGALETHLADIGRARIALGDGNDYLQETTSTFSLEVDGGAGNDVVVGTRFADVLRGGAGNDQLFAGPGDDRLEGGDGDDYMSGQSGTDTIDGGAGNDSIASLWGDGLNTTDGGPGIDKISVAGAGPTSSSLAITAASTRARIAYNDGSLAEDIGGIETIALATLNQANLVDVGNLTGTGVAAVNINLGGPDAFDGRVVKVNLAGSPAAERVTVTSLMPATRALDVVGFTARFRITGSNSDDRLEIDGGGGADQFTFGPGVESLISYVHP